MFFLQMVIFDLSVPWNLCMVWFMKHCWLNITVSQKWAQFLAISKPPCILSQPYLNFSKISIPPLAYLNINFCPTKSSKTPSVLDLWSLL